MVNVYNARTAPGASREAHQPDVRKSSTIQTVRIHLTGPNRPVGLKEAALDSPTFRATVVHFSEQIDLIEKWLDGYGKAVVKLTSEVSTLEGVVNTFITQSALPADVSEAVLDPDYTTLAMKRYGEGIKDFWSTTIASLRRLELIVANPIKSFLQVDIKTFKVLAIIFIASTASILMDTNCRTFVGH
jgi:hypothetical protein